MGSAHRRSFVWLKTAVGLARLVFLLSEPRMSGRLSVDSALIKLQALRQIRGLHPHPLLHTAQRYLHEINIYRKGRVQTRLVV